MSVHINKSTVLVLSGISGSGKSTFAKKLCEEVLGRVAVVSADDHFIDPYTQEYAFKPAELGLAHAECLRAFNTLMAPQETTLVIVDNTNTQNWERAPYMALGMAYGFDTWLVDLHVSPEVAHARNVHGVPLKAIESMALRIEEPPRIWQYQALRDGMTAKDLLTTIKAV